MTGMKRDRCGTRRLLKWTAGLTLQAFIFSNLFFTSPREIFAQEFPISVPARSSEAFLKIPSEFGKLDGLFEPLSGNQSVFFFHIKDAHASAEAQKNIGRILTRLHERKQLDLVLVEGAAGPLTPERLDVFGDAQKNTAYKNDLFNSGLLNGAAYFIAFQKSVSSYGLEDPQAYFEHLQVFRRVKAVRPGTEKFFNTVEVLMMNAFKNILRVDIFAFLKEWKMQHQKELSWDRYLPFLMKSAEKFLGLDLEDYRMQALWPNLVRFRHLDLLQDQVRLKTVQKEFQRISRILEHEQDPALRQTMTLLSVTIESPAGMLRETPDFRKHVEVLVNACRREGILLQQYPNLSRYLAVRIFRSEIDPEGLLAEVERMEDAIFDKLFSKGKMREILSAYRDFFILKRAFELELNRPESERFLAMDIEKKVRQFSKIAPEYDLQEEQVIRGANLVKRFYEAAQKRDGVFMKQVKNSLDKAKVFSDRPFFIALVAGGYHTTGIENWFRAEGLPFASIQPSFKDEPDTDRYEKFLMGDYHATDTLATAQGSIEPDAMAQKLMGRDAFLALRSAETNLMSKQGTVRSQSTAPAIPVRSPPLAGRSEMRGSLMGRRVFLLALSASLFSASASGQILDKLGKKLGQGRQQAREQIKTDRDYTAPEKDNPLPPAVVVDENSLALNVALHDPVLKKARFEIMIQQAGKGRLVSSISIRPTLGLVDGKPVLGLGVEKILPGIGSVGMGGFAIGKSASVVIDFAVALSHYLKGKDLYVKELAEQMVAMARLDLEVLLGERYLHYLKIAHEVKMAEEQIPVMEQMLQAIDRAVAVAEKAVRYRKKNVNRSGTLKANGF